MFKDQHQDYALAILKAISSDLRAVEEKLESLSGRDTVPEEYALSRRAERLRGIVAALPVSSLDGLLIKVSVTLACSGGLDAIQSDVDRYLDGGDCDDLTMMRVVLLDLAKIFKERMPQS